MDWLWQVWQWIVEFWQALSWNEILLGIGLFLVSLVISFAAIAIVMVNIPADYFSPNYQQKFLPNSPFFVRWGAVIFKNLIGLLLLGIGIIMIFTPGQGLVTILLGLVMLDIPGKRPLEAKIIQRPEIHNAINKLRRRFNKLPLVLD